MFPCTHCGNELPEGATFCNQCWKTVDASTPAPTSGGFTMPGAQNAAPSAPTSQSDQPAAQSSMPTFEAAPPPGGFASPPQPQASGWDQTAVSGSPWDAHSSANPQAETSPWGQPPQQGGGWATPPPPPASYGYQSGPYAAPGYYGPPAKSTNGLAIASLICSLAGLLTCLSAPVGIVLGHIALSQIKREGSNGRGLAIGGLVIGYLLTLAIVGFVIFAIIGFNSDTTY